MIFDATALLTIARKQKAPPKRTTPTYAALVPFVTDLLAKQWRGTEMADLLLKTGKITEKDYKQTREAIYRIIRHLEDQAAKGPEAQV